MSMSPNALTLQAGSQPAQAFLRVAGPTYNQGATITLPKLPNGVTATVAAAPNILGGFTITLTAAPGASVGTFVTSVQVLVAGITSTLPLTLTVQAALTDFQIVPLSGVTVKRGAGTSLHYLTIMRHATFAGVPITFSATGIPQGQGSVGFSPITIVTDVATMTLVAPANAALATHSLTITGLANGVTRTVTMPIPLSLEKAPVSSGPSAYQLKNSYLKLGV
jgi:hypothetical protein